MVDTVRTVTSLLTTLFQDGQASGSITPQDLRDMIVSLASFIGHVRVVTAAGTVTADPTTDRYIIISKTVAAITTVTLPAAPSAEKQISVKDGAGNAASFPITITATQNIDNNAGGTGIVLNQDYASVDLIYNGSTWSIV
jgi:hypothetical protein